MMNTKREKIKEILKKKVVFLLIGLCNIIIFHCALLALWFFLYDSTSRRISNNVWSLLLINTALIVFFSVPHSFLLKAKVKEKIFEFMPRQLYSTLYSLHASLAIILMYYYWQGCTSYLYRTQGKLLLIHQVVYGISWLFMLGAMISTGLLRQSGIEEWWAHLRGNSFKYRIPTAGAYSLCRHPIYFAFLAMVWSTPNMSYDHLYLSLSWSVYIIWGAGEKERRLIKNSSYRKYALQVPAFPFLNHKLDALFSKIIWRIK